MIQILVVHPTKLIGSLLTTTLRETSEENLYIVGQIQTTADTLDWLTHNSSHIVLVAANLPDDGALHLTQTIAAQYPDTKVLVFGLPNSKQAILQYVLAGASGYVLQEASVELLLEHIQAVHEEEALISPKMAALFMSKLTEMAQISAQTSIDPEKLASLTPREMEVLTLIEDGLTNADIGEILFIEVGTVKNHVHNILRKLDVSNRDEAAAHLSVT